MPIQRPIIEEEEIMEQYETDTNDVQESVIPVGRPYMPPIAYIGIILAILLGAVIIAISIVIASGRVPAGNSPVATNLNTNSAAGAGNSAPQKVNLDLNANYPMLGSAEASVTLVEFADFQCPFCKQFQDQTFSQIKSKYIDTGIVKFYFVSFPFLGDESTASAQAAECARQQGKFWEYHDLLYANQGMENSGVFNDINLKKWAKQLGLNATKFAACQKDPATVKAVADQFQMGQAAGVQATPTVFVNGKIDEGANPFSTYQSAIERARQGK